MLHSPNKFLQYLELRILFAMWVMYSLGHLLWRQYKLWLIISKYSYIENRGRTGLVVRASHSGLGDPGSILGRVGVLFP